jgi:hypothetical protein
MHPTVTGQIAAQRMAERHQQAARQRPVRRFLADTVASPRNVRVQAGGFRLGVRRSRPAAA